MTELQQFHATANAFLQALDLPPESFAADQNMLGIDVDERFSVRFSLEPGGTLLFQGDWQENFIPTGDHGDWLMVNQIYPGALQPVMALDEHGRPSCWMRIPDAAIDAVELVEAFEMMVGVMDHLTPELGA